MHFHKLKEQLLIFFGDISVGSQCPKVLMNIMNQHKSIFKAKECLNKNSQSNSFLRLI